MLILLIGVVTIGFNQIYGSTLSLSLSLSLCIYIYIYIERERERDYDSSYTFFKLLDLSRFNGKKKTIINVNILIRISLIIPHLLLMMLYLSVG